MSRIQSQLAAIHLLTHAGEHMAVSDQALEHATEAFEALAGDIFCAGAADAKHPTQEQKELLHAVLAGAPLGAGANRAHLRAIQAHIKGAQLTAPFSGAARAYLSTTPARLHAPPAPPPIAPAAPEYELQATPIAKRADGRDNLGDGDLEPLKQFALHLPDSNHLPEDVVAEGIAQGGLASLHGAVSEMARPYTFTGIAQIKLISAYLKKHIWVWSQHPSAPHVEMSALWSAGGDQRDPDTIDVLQQRGVHFNALRAEPNFIEEREGQPRRVALNHCAQAEVLGDGNCFYYSVAHATNRGAFRDAYDLVQEDANGVPDAKARLLHLVREHMPENAAIDGTASAQRIFRVYAEHVAHNFRQDVVEDILRHPDAYAPVIQNARNVA